MHPTVSAAGGSLHAPAAGYVCVCVHEHACILLAYPFRSADTSSSAGVSALPGEHAHPPKTWSTESTVSSTHNR